MDDFEVYIYFSGRRGLLAVPSCSMDSAVRPRQFHDATYYWNPANKVCYGRKTIYCTYISALATITNANRHIIRRLPRLLRQSFAGYRTHPARSVSGALDPARESRLPVCCCTASDVLQLETPRKFVQDQRELRCNDGRKINRLPGGLIDQATT